MTWYNRPTLNSIVGGLSACGKLYSWYEADVTEYLQSEKAAGRNIVIFGLHDGGLVQIQSREAGFNVPQLIVNASEQ